jgi:hypothetical protein
MGIKYDRKRYADEARARHALLGRTGGVVRRSPRNRLIVIYGGIAAFLFIILAMGGIRDSVFAAATREGFGRITSKTVDHLRHAGAIYVVKLEIELTPGQTLFEEFATEPEPWKKLRVGQRVSIVYKVDRQGNYSELLHVGVEKPPPLSP